jgi:hypothetical protein
MKIPLYWLNSTKKKIQIKICPTFSNKRNIAFHKGQGKTHLHLLE